MRSHGGGRVRFRGRVFLGEAAVRGRCKEECEDGQDPPVTPGFHGGMGWMEEDAGPDERSNGHRIAAIGWPGDPGHLKLLRSTPGGN